MAHFHHLKELLSERESSGRLYLEFLRIPAMSAGIYYLPKGGTDPQKPHLEDELYYVVQGRARMRVGGEDSEVSAGSLIFVEAKAEHKFHQIEEDLVVVVFFAPAGQKC